MLLCSSVFSGNKIKFDYVGGRIIANCRIIINGKAIPSNILIDLGIKGAAILHPAIHKSLNVKQGDSFSFRFDSGCELKFSSFDVVNYGLLNYFNNYESDSLEDIPFWAVLGQEAFGTDTQILLDIEKRELLFGDIYPVDNSALTITTKAGDSVHFADFEPLENYKLKAALSTSTFETWIDGVCADLADISTNGLDYCLLGGLDIARYTPIRRFDRSQSIMYTYDAVIGNVFWQSFKVVFDYSNNKIFLSPKDSATPNIALNNYYTLAEHSNYEAMVQYINGHPDFAMKDIEGLRILSALFSESNLNIDCICNVAESMLDIFSREFVVDAIISNICMLPKEKQLAPDIEKLLLNAKKWLSDSQDHSVKKYVIEARIGHILVATGREELGYEYLLSALFNQPDNYKINFFMADYYQRKGMLTRAWFRYLKAAASSMLFSESLNDLNKLYNSEDFRRSFSVGDNLDMIKTEETYFYPGLTRMDWKTDCCGLLEYFIFTDNSELGALPKALDTISCYCPDSGLHIVRYYIDTPDLSLFSSDYSCELAQRYAANGRPAVFLNGKAYGFSSEKHLSPELIVDDLYANKDKFDLVRADVDSEVIDRDIVNYTVSLPQDVKYSSCEAILVENAIMDYYGYKLSVNDNVCRLLADSLDYSGNTFKRQISLKSLQNLYVDRINNIDKKMTGLRTYWVSTYLDPDQCGLLLKFYDSSQTLCAIGYSPLNSKRGDK